MTALEQVIVDIEESEDILDPTDRAIVLDWLRTPTWGRGYSTGGWSRTRKGWGDTLLKDQEVQDFSSYSKLTELLAYDTTTVDANIFRRVNRPIYGDPTSLPLRSIEWLTRTRSKSAYKETCEWQTYI